MRFSALPAMLFILSLLFIFSCSGKADKSNKPVTTLEITPSAKAYRWGETLTLHIKTKSKKNAFKNAEVFLNNHLIVSGNQEEFTHEISEQSILGVNTIKIVAKNHDGNSYTLLRNFTMLSDSIPVNCTYRVLNESAHNKENFTQGLELNNGFLYEGTGENGKSAIYKIAWPSGTLQKSVKLDDRYFGEGITILNNRLYQLTYKHQKGFIYNLSELALTDSFRFVSQEGWGLTNDGESLIMSDGTGTLTWIDPETFSVVRRVQVADNLKTFQYLNELEYYKGYIWANIWGSDQIIKISAATGKVAAIVDLKGILSVMALPADEKVDVLNGIAIIPSSGNLLVTGKLWPKIFEIEVNCSEEGGGVAVP